MPKEGWQEGMDGCVWGLELVNKLLEGVVCAELEHLDLQHKQEEWLKKDEKRSAVRCGGWE